MRVLITGCGYVGLSLAKELAGLGHEVYGLRRSAEPGELVKAGIHPLMADVTQLATLQRLPAQYDWVVLCMASSGGTPEDYRRVYLEGSKNVIRWLSASPPQKLVYTSSTSVYGQADGSEVDESSPTEPSVETGRILLETERWLLGGARDQPVPAVVLRLAGIYGPTRGYWLRQYLAGEARLDNGGERFLNMIHRDDVVGATVRALQEAPPGQIYNVVDNEPVCQLTLFRWLSERLGRGMPPAGQSDSVANRKRGASNKRVSNRKLTRQLGYQLKYPTFREGFEAELRSMQEDSEWPK